MPRASRDLTGEKFGRLLVKERIGSKNGSPLWSCLCDCGNQHEATTSNLTKNTRSCGCLARETKQNMATHNNTGTATYVAWSHIKHDRIPRWDVFQVFLEDMGNRPKGAQLLKIDPLEPHGPENSYYRLPGNKRKYPDLPWMVVDFANLERVARQATRNGEGSTYACFRSKYQA